MAKKKATTKKAATKKGTTKKGASGTVRPFAGPADTYFGKFDRLGVMSPGNLVSTYPVSKPNATTGKYEWSPQNPEKYVIVATCEDPLATIKVTLSGGRFTFLTRTVSYSTTMTASGVHTTVAVWTASDQAFQFIAMRIA